MNYFSDLQFVGGAIMPNCTVVLDRDFPGTWSVEFIRSGRMAFGIDGAPQVILTGPVVFWHMPKYRYRYGAVDADGWHHHWVLLRGSRARRLVEEGFAALSSTGYQALQRGAVFADLFTTLIKLVGERGQNSHAEAVILLERMLCLAGAGSLSQGVSSTHLAVIEEIARSVECDPLRIVDFAVEATRHGLSYSHFRRLFRQIVGQPPWDFLLSCRMQKAARALTVHGPSIKQVAADFGYDDPAQFSRLFKKRIGLSPRAYLSAIPF